MTRPDPLKTPGGRLKAWLDMHLVDHGFIRAVYNNFYHLGGGMYRCSQPSPAQIRKYQRKYGIRSIINLRGENDYGTYHYEKDICRKLGIALHDTKLYSRNAPRVQEIKALGALFEQIEYPALMHCKSGADRAGLGAALYRILHLGHPVADAAAELNWRYGHFKKARTGVLDFFFASYLAETASEPVDFLTWLETRYDADALHAKFRAEGWSSLLVDKVLHRE